MRVQAVRQFRGPFIAGSWGFVWSCRGFQIAAVPQLPARWGKPNAEKAKHRQSDSIL